MKTLGAAMLEHLASGFTTLCSAVVLRPKDGTVLGFTDNVEALEVDGVLCKTISASASKANQSRADLSVAQLETDILLDDEAITEADILGGRYDFAEWTLYLVNYEDPTMFDIMREGWVGEAKTSQPIASVETRGLSQILQKPDGVVTSPTCRASLGDVRCGVPLATHTVTGSVTSVDSGSDRTIFRDSSIAEVADLFAYGVVTWASGAQNAGLQMEVKSSATNGWFELVSPMRFPVATGDAFDVVRGCNRLSTTCENEFDNLERMDAEIFLIGVDQLGRFGRQ